MLPAKLQLNGYIPLQTTGSRRLNSDGQLLIFFQCHYPEKEIAHSLAHSRPFSTVNSITYNEANSLGKNFPNSCHE